MTRVNPRQRGFTLVELMVTVGVVALLATIGYSSYMEQMAKSRRATARARVQEVMQHEERYYTENNAYTTTLTNLGYAATLQTDGNSHQISLASGATGDIATSVAVTATALIADTKCTSMTLDSGNSQTGTGSNSSVCWK